jgi:hypothetical protein
MLGGAPFVEDGGDIVRYFDGFLSAAPVKELRWNSAENILQGEVDGGLVLVRTIADQSLRHQRAEGAPWDLDAAAGQLWSEVVQGKGHVDTGDAGLAYPALQVGRKRRQDALERQANELILSRQLRGVGGVWEGCGRVARVRIGSRRRRKWLGGRGWGAGCRRWFYRRRCWCLRRVLLALEESF